MINTPYFNSEEIEEIINNPNDLVKYFKGNKLINEEFGLAGMMTNGDSEGMEEDEEYEDEEYEDEEGEENDVENMSDKEKVKLAYEILSMTSYEDDFFMSILGKLRKLMRK